MSDADGYTNGELISEPNVNAAVVGVTYAEPGETGGSADITSEGLVVTVVFTGGNPDEVRLVSWGDGTADDEYVLSDSGDQTCEHTYLVAGTYTVVGKDSAGNELASEDVTIAAPEPPPEPETE